MKFNKRTTIGFFILMLVVSGCVTTKYERPEMVTEKLYRNNPTEDTTSIADLGWKQLFTDKNLQDLIEKGLAQNLNLKQAVYRMESAQAYLKQTKMAFIPSLTLDVNSTDTKQSQRAVNAPVGFIKLTTHTNRIQLGTAWELDVWGKLRSAKKGALAGVLQSEAGMRAVQTQLIADIANAYYSLIALDQQLKVTEETVKIRKKQVETLIALQESGKITGADVAQSQANQYAAEVLVPDLKNKIWQTENLLNFLLAREPQIIQRSVLDEQTVYTDLKTGVSSQLLKNRPDVQQAEYAFIVAFENTNVAKTYFYPSFTLTANGGFASFKIQELFSQSIFYNIISGLTQPIFNQGKNKMRLRQAKADQQVAYYAFQNSILQGGQEVSNALYAYQNAVDREQLRKQQIDYLVVAVDATRELLSNRSGINYTDVLTSEQNLIAAQLSGINDKLDQLQAVVNLYRALGGGWK
ncbi:efflux transporter outer membrane subunit [Fluviicola sp.]|jgi:NodT family efflux transporter outer membrane factor (OMF) lipoprotein|uniref:efflux transporter outer membrane subunit n=1 Tax=Fluviicola sp. TaxID=1917219 RepID=UPI00281F86DD|nr:efflux transporter outer membrane subunit [Fluviicola sp.]MDR0802960.1 efflux transporter outer membrane subunit [Fluviicola sp.]